MSLQVTTAFVQQYSANVQMLSQQMGSRLRDAVRVENMVGNNAFFDQVGKATAQKRTTRHADTPQIDTPDARRRVSLLDYEFAELIDDQDKVHAIDPTSAYAKLRLLLWVVRWMMRLSHLLWNCWTDWFDFDSSCCSADC